MSILLSCESMWMSMYVDGMSMGTSTGPLCPHPDLPIILLLWHIEFAKKRIASSGAFERFEESFAACAPWTWNAHRQLLDPASVTKVCCGTFDFAKKRIASSGAFERFEESFAACAPWTWNAHRQLLDPASVTKVCCGTLTLPRSESLRVEPLKGLRNHSPRAHLGHEMLIVNFSTLQVSQRRVIFANLHSKSKQKTWAHGNYMVTTLLPQSQTSWTTMKILWGRGSKYFEPQHSERFQVWMKGPEHWAFSPLKRRMLEWDFSLYTEMINL